MGLSAGGDACYGQQTEEATMNLIDLQIRLQDLNEAIADLERQQEATPGCEIIADSLHAYTTKASAVEVAIRQR